MSDLGVISPLRASCAMYAVVPTILPVMTVEHDCLDEARVKPKSEIFATKPSSNKMFPLLNGLNNVDDCFINLWITLDSNIIEHDEVKYT